MKQDCPLCKVGAEFFLKREGRSFFRCGRCDLIYVLASERLDLKSETERYKLHRNSAYDQNYRAFLNQLLIPLGKVLKPGAQGLDYGCGPGPAISVIMQEHGFHVTNYDPIFLKNEKALEQKYDFITCTEVAEHFFNPAQEFERINQMLHPGGWLGVMTSLHLQGQGFESWHYAKDPTHVSFYSSKTIEWIAERYKWNAKIERENVILFHKPKICSSLLKISVL